VLLLVAPVARGASRNSIPDLSYDLRADLPIIAASIGWTVYLGVRAPEHSSCDWCERDGLNPVDEWFRDRLALDDPRAVDPWVGAATGLTLLGTLGLNVAGGLDAGAGADTLAIDALIVIESVSVALALAATSKYVFTRQRPYAIDIPDAEFAGAPRPDDENRSFFSGHTAVGFALVVSSATVTSMRGYRLAPWVLGVGLPLATTVGALRIAQDQHHFTDLLTGAVVGSAVGFALPYFFHGQVPVVVTANPESGALFVGVEDTF
jgi:membrane-associated phospholipid phosphatase